MSGLLDVDRYRDNGFVLARGVFAEDEVATLRREIDALLQRAEEAGRKTEVAWAGAWREAAGVGTPTAVKTRAESIHNVQNHSAVFTRMLVDPRLVDPATEPHDLRAGAGDDHRRWVTGISQEGVRDGLAAPPDPWRHPPADCPPES